MKDGKLDMSSFAVFCFAVSENHVQFRTRRKKN